MTTLTVADLKEKLKERGLPTTGPKSELLRRLREAGADAEELGLTDEVLDDESQREVGAQSVVMAVQENDLLRRERDLAAREVELLRRELELLRTTQQPGGNVPVRASVRKWQDLKDLIGECDGGNLDFDRWEKQVEKLLSSYDLSEHQAKALICSKLSGKALRWFHSRIDCVELSCEDLLQGLKQMYGQRVDPLKLRRKLQARMWNAGESFADYLHDKVILANRIPVAEAELISYVIEGIPSQELRTQARVQCYQSTDEMLMAFADVPSPKGAPRKPSTPTQKKPQDGEQKPEKARTVKCYNCNEAGHVAAKCTKPKRERGSCYRCGKLGHRAAQCDSTNEGVKDSTKEGVHWVTSEQREDNDFRRKVELQVNAKDGNVSINLDALIDSGSPISFVRRQYIPQELMIVNSESDRFVGINGSGLRVLGCVNVTLIYDYEKYAILLRVVPDDTMQSSVILGRDFMKEARLSIGNDREVNEIMSIDVDQDCLGVSARDMQVNDNLPLEVKQRARELLEKRYLDAPRPSEPATENIMSLTLTSNEPFYCKPRKLSFYEKGKLREILDELIAKGIIRESTSEYASPIVLTKKKNGETRMCVDFRALNKITTRDHFPLPLIEDQLDLLEGKRYFTTLDLKDGFFHIKMHEESIKYTSFVTPLGQYEYVRMPFGLKGAPLKFQRYVTQVFKDPINAGDIYVYLDDFLIATETIEHHFQILRKVFELLVANRLELRLDKCRFLQTKLDYLGYTITSQGIRPTDQGLVAVKNFPIPRNLRD
ncbi:PREDICTED: uncharacterized protein LOC105565665, partial [Vollenhovia emeryi]|uniref:uncharacterized protein LOC105565665 n=1 Tax=Vollenhovia emeryi TaxID=411798 RepID=UPI0005F5118C